MPNSSNQHRTGPLTVAGLFAGIGGIERGFEKTGRFSTALFSERDPAAVAVLRDRFPDVPVHHDVRELGHLPRGTQVVTAGFPCQDLSPAGETRGITGSKSGLVVHVFELLRKTRVPWVLLENVPFMLHLNRGRAMDFVISALEELGYSWAYRTIDTNAFGIPQRRERLYILASNRVDPSGALLGRNRQPDRPMDHRGRACGFYWTEGNRGLGWAIDAIPTLKAGSAVGIPSPPGIWMPDGRIVTPDIRDAERLQGFPRGWTRAAEGIRPSLRWRLVGNAVSVPVATWLGERIVGQHDTFVGTTKRLPQRTAWPRAAFGSSGVRFAADVTAWPVRRHRPSLVEFLRFPTKPLSHRATSGFATRLARSPLSYPEEFWLALHEHVHRSADGQDVVIPERRMATKHERISA